MILQRLPAWVENLLWDLGSLGLPSAPRIGGDVFRYRLHSADGDDLGQATYAVMIKPGEEILLGAGKRFRVLAVVPFPEGRTSRRSSGFYGSRRSRDHLRTRLCAANVQRPSVGQV
jgi:hypothetical protein